MVKLAASFVALPAERRSLAFAQTAVRMAASSVMVENHALCARVVEWKSRVFARQWARYDIAKPGTFRLVPPPARRAALARDYAQMRAMFLSAPPSFEAVLDVLDDAQRRLNAR